VCATHAAFQSQHHSLHRRGIARYHAGPDLDAVLYALQGQRKPRGGRRGVHVQFELRKPNPPARRVAAVDYGTSLSLWQLPVTQVTYDGRDANAPWRAVAAANIAKNRMADLTVHVLDAQGAPVSNAQVSVNMIRNAFGFGTAQAGHDFLPGASSDGGVASPDGGVANPWDTYRSYLPSLFNISVEENALKWPIRGRRLGPQLESGSRVSRALIGPTSMVCVREGTI